MSSPRNISRMGLPTIPTGDTVASYPTYEAARGAVDMLVREEGMPLDAISIVGSDLKSVERVTGRMNFGRAALSGLMNGVMIGLFLSLMWLIFFPTTDFLSVIGVFVMSLAFGVIWGVLGYALSPQKREFTSIMQVTASRFDLIVPQNLSGKVRDILQRGGSWGQPQASSPVQPQAQPGVDAGAQQPVGQSWQQPGGQGWQQPGSGQVGSGHVGAGHGGAGQPGTGHSGAAGQPDHAGSAAQAQPAQPEQPAHPPRTYGEMEDELRRQERERQLQQQRGQQQNQPQGDQSREQTGDHS
ncbi:MAG: general stress protein [Gulosibacter sp.]|uniref:general stress protein n=1 Tax=Gulosibacter sp. TaxID=2817531 RepID=UPI003F8ECB43